MMIDVSSSHMAKTIDRHNGDLLCCYYRLAIGDFCSSISAIDSNDAIRKNDNFFILLSKQQAGHQVLVVVFVIDESLNLIQNSR